MLLGLGIAVLVLVADQLSKLYVAGHLLNGRGVIMVGDYFNIVTAWNTGVSFSMFNNRGIWGTICLSLIAVSIVAYLLYWLTKEKKPLIQVSLGFIIGGALGNVVDRADSFICIGAFLIIADSILSKKAEKNTGTEEK